jgi:hypothetical protein
MCNKELKKMAKMVFTSKLHVQKLWQGLQLDKQIGEKIICNPWKLSQENYSLVGVGHKI